jgi:hypothetical protein
MDTYSMSYYPTQTVFYDVAADAQKQDAEHWAIMNDTQTKIFCINPTTTVKSWQPAPVGTPYIRCGFTNWRIAAMIVWMLNHAS